MSTRKATRTLSIAVFAVSALAMSSAQSKEPFSTQSQIENIEGGAGPDETKGFWADLWSALFGNEKPPAFDSQEIIEQPNINVFAPLPLVFFPESGVTVMENAREIRVPIAKKGGAGEKNVRVKVEALSNVAPGATKGVFQNGATQQTQQQTQAGSAQKNIAAPGVDFDIVGNGEVFFGHKDEEAYVTVRIYDDQVYEPKDKSIKLVLVEPHQAKVRSRQSEFVITLRDDDSKPQQRRPASIRADVEQTDFGRVFIGGEAVRTITFRNHGEVPGVVTFVDVAGGEQFQVQGDACQGKSLPGGGQCRVVVKYMAATPGAHKARLLITASSGGADGASAPLQVALQGTGVERPQAVDPLAAQIEAARLARRTAPDATLSFDPPDVALPTSYEYEMSAKDWPADMGLGKETFSFPVDRTRIITKFQTIPCVLEYSINSQVPGYVTCQVEANVYGGDRRFVLIPGGSMLFGDYQSLANVGDTRLNIIWREIMRPDGSRVVMDSGFQGLDAMGQTGQPGVVDNKMFERFAMPLATTLLSAASALAVPADNASATNAQTQAAEGIGRVATQMLDENVDVRPVISISKGARMHIRPLADLWFKTPNKMAVGGIDSVPTLDAPLDGPKG